MKPAAFKVLYGHRVMLTGRLLNGGAGRHVAIIARPYGRQAARVATVTTGEGGRFSLTVKPRIMTTYQARLGTARPSGPMTVGVRPVLSVAQLAGGKLRARIVAAKGFGGRMVKLQRRTGSGWQTIAKQPLHGSAATFVVSLPTGMVRVAMSVNQAGAGYLGTDQPRTGLSRGLTPALPTGTTTAQPSSCSSTTAGCRQPKVTVRRSMRWPSTLSTWKTIPSWETSSPGSAARPSCPKTNPAMVW